MIDEDEVGLKEKPEDTRYIRKDYIKIRPKHRECGQRNLIPTLPLLGLQTRKNAGALSLRAPSGGVKCPGHVAPTTGSQIVVPPIPKEEVFNVFEPKRGGQPSVYHIIFNHGIQGTATWSQLSFVPLGSFSII